MRVIDETITYNGTLNNLEELHENLNKLQMMQIQEYSKGQEYCLF